MAAKEISVKKYVVRLSGEERERLETLIRKGTSPARRVLKARILLKADVSEAGKGWSDNQIIEALETSPSMVYRVRKQLVEEGFEAVLSRKPRALPAVARIFDGEKEAKLIALACSKPPKGRARWTLRLLENKVVELGIVDRASDSTIGRALKKTLFSPIAASTGSFIEWIILSQNPARPGELPQLERIDSPHGHAGHEQGPHDATLVATARLDANRRDREAAQALDQVGPTSRVITCRGALLLGQNHHVQTILRHIDAAEREHSHLRIPFLLMRARAQPTVRVWKKRPELQAQLRFGNRNDCGLPVATGVRS